MGDFRKSTVYQIYVKSFKDTTGNGKGDINGITVKLDYLKEIGVDYIWTTPFYTSPMRDNGYDVADYRAVDRLFGSLEDVERLISEAGKRGIGLMLDMVFNHTSTEHIWFKRALAGDEKYMKYYIFREGSPDAPPTNWQSKFGGSAWEYVPKLGKWYLHLFDVTQADLNWDNPEVREELKEVILFWKSKGVKGFRFDVVNLISKPEILENDCGGDGRRFYTDGPNVHEYLHELVRDTGIKDMVTVGEMSSTSLENCIRYSNPGAEELSMVFNFHHLKVDYKDCDKWSLAKPDYRELKKLFKTWQLGMQENNGWNAVFWCNHDQPRIVSRLGAEGELSAKSAKMLAACIHLLRGTPYIYQGEELGMLNPGFTDISQYRDVESINYYKILIERGVSEAEALDILAKRSRDNGRTPMQWSAGKNAGFTDGEPWIGIPENYKKINAEAELADEDSVLAFYKKLVALRKKYRAVSEGSIEFIEDEADIILAYRRKSEDEEITVLNNLSGEKIALEQGYNLKNYEVILCNYPEYTGVIEELRPYENITFYKRTNKC